MGKEHLDPLPELHRDLVLAGLRDVSGDLAGVFVFFVGDGSGICIRAAFCLGPAGQFQGAVFGSALSGRSPARVGIVSSELLQLLAFGADILVVLGVPFEVRPGPGEVGASALVEHRHVRRDLAIDQPAQHRSGAVGRIRDEAFGLPVKPGLHAVQHGLGQSYLGLPDRSRGFDINDDTVIGVDQVIVGIADERRPLACCGPRAGRLGMRGVLGLVLLSGPERGLVPCFEILPNRAGRTGRVDPCRVPFLLRGRVLFVGVRLDHASADGHALATDQTFRDAARDGRLKQMAQQFAVAKPTVAVLGKGIVIRHPVAQTKAAEPAICEVQMDLLAEPPL